MNVPLPLPSHVAHVAAKLYGDYKKSYDETHDTFFRDGMLLIKRTLENNGFSLLRSSNGKYYVRKITGEDVENG